MDHEDAFTEVILKYQVHVQKQMAKYEHDKILQSLKEILEKYNDQYGPWEEFQHPESGMVLETITGRKIMNGRIYRQKVTSWEGSESYRYATLEEILAIE